MLTNKTTSERLESAVRRGIRRALPCSIFGLQLAYWPYKQAFPIQQLPPELLAEIFTCCLPAAHESTEPSVRSAPLNISAVCRSWRELALSLPRLWARFQLLQKASLERDVSAVAAIGLWLERSQKSPLSFTIGNGYQCPQPDDDEKMVLRAKDVEPFRDLCEKVLEHQKRWKSVVIDYDFEHPVPTMPLMNMVDMPLLEDLHVCLPVKSASALIHFSPYLRTLSLSCEFTLILPQTPLAHLTKVHLDYGRSSGRCAPIFADDILMFLQKAPNLEELSAVVWGGVDAPNSELSKIIRFPSLRKLFLHFHDTDGAFVKSVLSRLSFPALEDFELRADAYPREGETLGVASLLSRSRASLTSFSLRAPAVPETEILACLRRSPSLVHLSIVDHVSGPGPIISALTLYRNGQSEDLCPKLETLQFSAHRLRFVYEDFAFMMASRWDVCDESCGKLREVRMREQDTWFVGRAPHVERCVEEGLRLIAFDSFLGTERTAL